MDCFGLNISSDSLDLYRQPVTPFIHREIRELVDRTFAVAIFLPAPVLVEFTGDLLHNLVEFFEWSHDMPSFVPSNRVDLNIVLRN